MIADTLSTEKMSSFYLFNELWAESHYQERADQISHYNQNKLKVWSWEKFKKTEKIEYIFLMYLPC